MRRFVCTTFGILGAGCIAVACATSSTPGSAGTGSPDAETERSAPDSGGHSVVGDGGGTHDAHASTSSGTYQDRGNTCCGKGQGLACCTADAGLLGYDVEPDGSIVAVGGRSDDSTIANCFVYGGVAGACGAEGERIDQKDLCSVCCDGLVAIDTQCVPNGPCLNDGDDYAPSLKICTHCGDGTCGTGESHGNCPADCR